MLYESEEASDTILISSVLHLNSIDRPDKKLRDLHAIWYACRSWLVRHEYSYAKQR
jgi:hypothetical protein